MSNSYKGSYTDFLRALGYRESGGRYNIENSYGYLGKYQMGEMALIDAGYYKGDSTPRKNDWIGEWTGKDGVWSKEDFLNNPQAQENAIREFHRKIWKYIKALDLDRYVGKTIAGIYITESGLVGGAHLVGVRSLAKFLKSNGSEIPRDGFGTPITEYISKFNGYDISEITGSTTLTPEEKKKIQEEFGFQWDIPSTPETPSYDEEPEKDEKKGGGGIFEIIIKLFKAIFSIFSKK
ncbi:MAG: hypothetical protein DSY66_02675 [Persephonella sp.]|nr:MAG: hypothetical protein DSY66_02675 [Persephonella sp.]